MEKDSTNYGILVAPEQWYPVTYTIDQSGKKHIGATILKGKDLTENQIKELLSKVDVNQLMQ